MVDKVQVDKVDKVGSNLGSLGAVVVAVAVTVAVAVAVAATKAAVIAGGRNSSCRCVEGSRKSRRLLETLQDR